MFYIKTILNSMSGSIKNTIKIKLKGQVGINLIKEVHDLQSENYKMFIPKMEKKFLVYGSEDNIIKKIYSQIDLHFKKFLLDFQNFFL